MRKFEQTLLDEKARSEKLRSLRDMLFPFLPLIIILLISIDNVSTLAGAKNGDVLRMFIMSVVIGALTFAFLVHFIYERSQGKLKAMCDGSYGSAGYPERETMMSALNAEHHASMVRQVHG